VKIEHEWLINLAIAVIALGAVGVVVIAAIG